MPNSSGVRKALRGLNDSKQLSSGAREKFDLLIRRYALSFGIGLVEAWEIDEVNILQATFKAMRQALEKIDFDFALIDGNKAIPGSTEQRFLIKGDEKSISIAAASVIAKVYRDDLMVELDREFPGYGFARHKGYGTKEHQEKILLLGPTPQHRRSFRWGPTS
ncbi:MAG TPA: ribonuclease HII [Cyanobacteria bacterium UBA8530]|nr:ribonuclease HII [Cyanobacteria bacterium UBA8530]